MTRSGAHGRPGSMVLPVSVAQTGQSVEDRALPDRCTIGRAGQGRVWEAALGVYVDTATAVIYAGPCRVGPYRPRDRHADSGDQSVALTWYAVTVPVGTVGIKKDDVVTVTGSNDPNLIGRALRVDEYIDSTTQTAMRLVCHTIES